MIRKIFLLLISLLIGLSLFIWVGKAVGWEGIKKAFSIFSYWQGLLILGLTFLAALIAAWKWGEILKGLGIRLSFRNLWRAYLASFSIRYLVPGIIVGSEIFQGHIIKELNSIPWSKGMASIIIDRVIEWTANLVVIFLGFSFFLWTRGLPPTKLAAICSGIILLFIFLVVTFYFKSFKKESITKTFARLFNPRLDKEPLEIEKESFNFFRPRKKEMWIAFGASFLRAGIMLLRTWILILFLGKSISFWPALAILGFSYFVLIIPIPAALGSHEAVQALAFSSLGIGASTGTAFTMIMRGADIILAIFGVVFLFHLGVNLLRVLIFKKIDKHNNQNRD